MRRLYYNDDEFSQAFSELKNYREVPPVGNWRQINAKLDKRTTYRYTRLIGFTTILGVIIGLGLSIYYSTEPARLRTQALKHEKLVAPPVAEEPIATKPFVKWSNNASTSEVNIEATLDKVDAALINIEQSLAVLNDARAYDIIKPLHSIGKTNLIAPLKPLDYHAYEMLTGISIEQTNNNNKCEPLPNYVCAPFYVGVNIQPQHTMLLSRDAVSNPNVNYKFSPGLAYGVSAGYRLSNAWALEAGGMLSMENNRYEAAQAQQAKKVAKLNAAPSETPMQQYKLALSYYRIPLMVKFRMPWNPKRRSICEESVSMIGGVQYGYFRNGFNTRIDATPEAQTTDVVTEDIKRSDVQVLTGVERSSSLSRHLSVNYGFRVGYGLRQISSLETERVAKFNNPHNLSAAFNLALTFSK